MRLLKLFSSLLFVMVALASAAVTPVAAAAAPSPAAPASPGTRQAKPPAHHPSEPLTSGPAADAPARVPSARSAAPSPDPATATPAAPKAAPAQDWPMFLHDLGHNSASTEGILSPANASLLKQGWKTGTGGVIAAAPAVVGGVVYVGSWDGFEYALDAKTGAVKWKTNLGTTTNTACHPPTIGVTSGAAVQNGVVYVGGGDANWYALDAATGTKLWSVFTGDNSQAGGHYNWSSPVLFNGFAYIGVASNCDNPLVQGQLLKVDLNTHLVVGMAKFVPDGQVGGGVWTSPAIDATTGTIYVTTGTLNLATQTLSEALVAVDSGSMAIKDFWQLPRSQAGSDSDWGTSPILFTGGGKALVAAVNKNGVLYAFDRANLAAGKVWQTQIAIGGDCPTCGDGSISSGAFANGVLYFAGGNTTIGGVGYRGAVRAFSPDTGVPLWEHGTDQPVLPSIAWVNGTIVEAEGSTVEVLDAATGKSLYDYPTGGPLYAAPAVSNGSVFFGSSDSNVYALTIGTATTPPADPNCPAGFTCQDIRNPQKGSESTSGSVLTVTASGAAIHGTSDQFRFLYQKTAGDVEVTTHMLSQSTQNTQPQAGLMVRQSSDPAAPFYGLLEYPNNLTENQPKPKLLIWYRTAFGVNSIEANKIYPASLPKYIGIQRQGNVFTGMVSDNGINWQLLPGSRQTIVMPDQVLTGIAQNSGATGNTGTATYSNTTVGKPSFTPTPPQPATPCSQGWGCQDVGDTSPVGDQSLGGGVWTLKGVGNDIGGTQDFFHYVWQTLPGDGVLTARLNTLTNTSANAKAGIMMRQNLDPGSPYYGVFLTPGGNLLVQWRVNSNLVTRPSVTQTGAPPLYLRITRYTESGTTTYTAFTSSDGSNWAVVLGSTVTVNMSGTLLAGMAADANAARVQNTVTFDKVSLTAGAQRPPTLCPVGWTCTDVGTATPPGGQSFDGKTWTFLAGGPDIWDTYDGYRFAYQQLAGDGSVSARVVSQAKGGIWQKSGVMLRAINGTGVDPSAPYYGVFVTPSNGVVVQYRTQQAAFTAQPVQIKGTAAPVFLKVSRFTDPNTKSTQYTAYTSPDGTGWTLVPGSAVTLNITPPMLAGLAADSYAAVPATTVFDSVSISNGGTPPPCLTGWTCADIGQPTPAGQQTLNADKSISVQGGGGDIWNVSDQFHFVWQQVPGDVAVSAQASSQTPTDPWAKAGVMLRASADPGSPYFAALVTPGHGVDVQFRTAQGGITSQVLGAGGVPVYLRVSRVGTTFTAYTSADGATWTVVPGSAQTVAALGGNILGGLAVTSHNTTLLSTVQFNAIAFGAATSPCPAGWTCADVGGPTPAGSETVISGNWTVQGGGGDIWDVADQFRFESQPLPGNALVSARLTAQGNTSPWAKAGVMLRATSDPRSPYFGVFLTPSNGVVVQYRTAQGAGSSNVPTAGAPPLYMAVGRSGTTFTAYTSADGQTWTAIPNSSLVLGNLGGTLLAGLAVTSHNTSLLSAVSFDNVTSSPNLPAASPRGGRQASAASPAPAPAARQSSRAAPASAAPASPSPSPSPPGP
ncbi:MAG: PQQ-binding-like beta-propeller repeat protein [Candidatus Dormibacteraeota bacterium]|nr:PQQ-binding-like beta-propeller repeat protein [Candidatus Dormibacteraeota bacterium]